jgi:hypothetical protein
MGSYSLSGQPSAQGYRASIKREAHGAAGDGHAEEACGPCHARGGGRRGYRWGHAQGKISFHAGKVDVERPRVRGLDGKELGLPSTSSRGGLAWAVGDEPDAHAKSVGRCGFPMATFRHLRVRRIEVGGVAALCDLVCGAHEGVDGGWIFLVSTSWSCRSTASTLPST